MGWFLESVLEFILVLIIPMLTSVHTPCTVYEHSLYFCKFLHKMTLEDPRSLTAQLLETQQGLVFDVQMEHQDRHGVPAPAGVPGVAYFSAPVATGEICQQTRNGGNVAKTPSALLASTFSQHYLAEGYLIIRRLNSPILKDNTWDMFHFSCL